MKTDLTVILDRSGSMSVTRSAAIEGFNALVTDQKKVEGACNFSLCHFDTIFNDSDMPAFDNKPIAEVPLLTFDTYIPRGGTALYDAMGRTINAIGARLSAQPEAERPANVIVVIITDGQENSSREFNAEQIRQMVEHQRGVYQWQFIYIGSNHDAIMAARQVGVLDGNTMSYDADHHGTRAAYSAVSQNVMRSRQAATPVMAAAALCFSDDQRAEHDVYAGNSTSSAPSGTVPRPMMPRIPKPGRPRVTNQPRKK